MNMEKVFAISSVEKIDGSFRVGGRVLKSLKVGDRVYAEETANEKQSFEIIEIQLYEKFIEEVDEIFTPWITLKTEMGILTNESKNLFRFFYE